jgi:hypothetical protein
MYQMQKQYLYYFCEISLYLCFHYYVYLQYYSINCITEAVSNKYQVIYPRNSLSKNYCKHLYAQKSMLQFSMCNIWLKFHYFCTSWFYQDRTRDGFRQRFGKLGVVMKHLVKKKVKKLWQAFWHNQRMCSRLFKRFVKINCWRKLNIFEIHLYSCTVYTRL